MTENRSSALDALSGIEAGIKASRWGLVFAQLSINATLWSIYYFLCHWLGETLQFQQAVVFPIWPISLLTAVFFALSVAATGLRRRAGNNIQRAFYQRFFAELDQKRWALIRSKPITAWQDVSFRHLPALESYLLDYLPQRSLIMFVPLLVLMIVFPISWLAGLILFITLPLMPLFMWLVGAGTASAQKKHITALNRLGLFFSDRIKGASTVRILNQQAAQLAAFERASDEHNNRLAEVIRLAFLNTSVLDFFATVSMALVAVFIGFNLLGEVPFGFYGSPATLQSGLFILLLSPAFFAELKKLGKLYHVKSEATASADLWQHTLQWQQDNNRSANIDQPFHSLNLSDTTVLGLDGHALLSIGFCSLTKTDRVWLQGISGSGKSVVLDALAGLRDIKPGQCIINQRPAENLDELREQCFYLGQQPIFFDGTLRENLGLNQFDDKSLISAIETVGMSDWFYATSQGLDTQLNEHTPLSGGQKQKLALARLKLFDKPLVLLDEPLAHLSIAEQNELLPVLLRLTQERCSVWVSHIALPEQQFNKRWVLQQQVLTEETE